jgi:hypothetical protein
MAAEITDYPSLSAAFENYLARTDLTEFLPYFVRVTEAWLNRQLRTREMMATAPLAAAAPGYTIPGDYLEWIAAQWTSADAKRVQMLRYVEPDSPEFRHRYRPGGDPQYFSVLGDQVQTRSLQPGAVSLTYYRQIPPLSADKPTNWLLTKAPELYLYGVMAEAYRFQKDEARNQKWLADGMSFLQALMGQGDSQKTGGRPRRTAEDQAEATARDTPN